MFTRRTRLLITGGLLTLVILGAVILQSPDPTRTVDEVMANPSGFVDEDFAIRGEVKDGTIDNSSMTFVLHGTCLLYTSPSPRDKRQSRMPSSA